MLRFPRWIREVSENPRPTPKLGGRVTEKTDPITSTEMPGFYLKDSVQTGEIFQVDQDLRRSALRTGPMPSLTGTRLAWKISVTPSWRHFLRITSPVHEQFKTDNTYQLLQFVTFLESPVVTSYTGLFVLKAGYQKVTN